MTKSKKRFMTMALFIIMITLIGGISTYYATEYKKELSKISITINQQVIGREIHRTIHIDNHSKYDVIVYYRNEDTKDYTAVSYMDNEPAIIYSNNTDENNSQSFSDIIDCNDNELSLYDGIEYQFNISIIDDTNVFPLHFPYIVSETADLSY